MAPKNQSHRIDELLAGVTADLLAGNPQQFEDTSLRVERILLEMVRPDPIQPRRVLPEQLHFAFHNNRLCGLIAYCHQPRKPSLALDLPQFEALISN